jgi:peptidoglycan/LPS O-acetylase OafA/YrhL
MSALSKNIAPAIAPPTPKKKGSGSKMGRMLELDGYRGLAAVGIIIVHAWMQGGNINHGATVQNVMFGLGASAVALFFALSGMVTFLPFARGALTGKVPNGKQFLVRRLFRVLPLYYVLVFTVWASRYAGTPQDWHDLIRHLTFTQVYSKDHLFWLDGPSWSLADEMHFYVLIALIAPWLTRVATKRSTTARRLAVMALFPAILLVASVAYTTIVTYVMNVAWSSSYTYYNPLARVDAFALGIGLALVMCVPGVLKARPSVATMLSVTGLVSLGVLWWLRPRYQFVNTYFFTLAGVTCLLTLAGAAMLHERQLLGRFLRSKPIQLWALTGFSLYLWHEPVMIQLARWHILYFRDPVAWPLATVGLVASATLVAWLSYNAIERPGVRVEKLIRDLRARQRAGVIHRSGPPPRWIPDLTLATADGSPIALRDLPKDRPVLIAFEADEGRRLAEQRFRIDAREAHGFYVTAGDGRAPAGTTVLVDRDGRLTEAMNIPTALIEVSPGGSITAVEPVEEPETGQPREAVAV